MKTITLTSSFANICISGYTYVFSTSTSYNTIYLTRLDKYIVLGDCIKFEYKKNYENNNNI